MAPTIKMLRNIEIISQENVARRLQMFKEQIKDVFEQFVRQIHTIRIKRTNLTTQIGECIDEEVLYLEIMENEALEELNECTVLVLEELNRNLEEVESFMSVPITMYRNLESCVEGTDCSLKLFNDMFFESLGTSSKVLTMGVRLQQHSFHLIDSLTNCGLDGVAKVAYLGAMVLEEVLYCLDDKTKVT